MEWFPVFAFGGFEMKKFLLATVAFGAVSVASSAFAADLAARPYTKAPPMIATVYDWSGFYIGANGGYGTFRDHRFRTDLGLDLGSYDPDGGVAGGQIGYRWQSSAWVFGFEAQGDWASLKGSTQNQFNAANQIGSRIDAFGLFTGQIGYAWDRTLLYVKGGAAVVDQRFDFIANATGQVAATSGYDTRWGATVGAGIEYAFAPSWSVAFEYDHIFLNRHDVGFTFTGGILNGTPVAGTYRSGGDVDLATVRINYKWGGPLLAKY
jgi:outer membrane immunogenic protein